MNFVAFQLTDEFAGVQEDGETPIYGGGQVAKIDGTTFDVGQELEDGEGIIVVPDNDTVIEQLRALPCLEEVAAPEAVEAELEEELTQETGGDVELSELSHDDLKAQAEARGLSKGGSSEDLVTRIEEHDHQLAADAEGSSDDSTESTEGAQQ